MYKIELKEYLDIVSLDDLCWGIENDIISPETAIDYANEYLNKIPECDSNKLIDLLILDEYSKEDILEIITPTDNVRNVEREKRAIRYVILHNISEKTANTDDFFELVESVYADFGYPSDMDRFIPYMPSNDEKSVSHLTEIERKELLVSRFKAFLKAEHSSLK